MGEFELIEQFFTRPATRAVLGVGDDCALVQPRSGMQMAISTDMLVCERHFFADADPYGLGHKALAVNLSDLAACGATPIAFTLALALPDVRPEWLEPFSRGLFALADAHQCELIGGDTTRGPLTISITVFGDVPPGLALLRSGAREHDDIYVSGTLGDAALGLDERRGKLPVGLPDWSAEQLSRAHLRMDRPTPRVALGIALRGVASAAADISDGLSGDLGHILKKSGVGATLFAEPLLACMMWPDGATPQAASVLLRYVLAGGDDYELVFTAPPERRLQVARAASDSNTVVTRIGQITRAAGLRVIDPQGNAVETPFSSFDHFAPSSQE